MDNFKIFTPDFTTVTMPKYYYLGVEFLKRMDDRGGYTYPNMYQQVEHKVIEGRDTLILSYIDKPSIQVVAHLGDVLMILPCGIAKILTEVEFKRLKSDRLVLLSKVKEYTEQAKLDWLAAEMPINAAIERKESKKSDVQSGLRGRAMAKSDSSADGHKKVNRSKKSSKNSTI